MRSLRLFSLLLLFLAVPRLKSDDAGAGAGQLLSLMPRVADRSSMMWAEGFPGVIEGVTWLRCIETGHYAFVLNTETLEVPHFGVVAEDVQWKALPPAELSLRIKANGKTYEAMAGGKWTRFTGPRLIESGRLFQRSDVTDLVFSAADGALLNVEARLETAAWPDRLGLILSARPGQMPLAAGEGSFGRVRGGFGLDGTSYFEIPSAPEWDPANFTLEFWAFVPTDFQASANSPWLVCKNRNEVADGNYGIMIRHDGAMQARINLGGGGGNQFILEEEGGGFALQRDSWNHLALSYDGNMLRLYANGRIAGGKKIGKVRVPVPGPIAFGRRQDNFGDGYRFRGIVDEIRLYDRVLTLEELRGHFRKPEQPEIGPGLVGEWVFRENQQASMAVPGEQWRDASMEVQFSSGTESVESEWASPEGELWTADQWKEVSIGFTPETRKSDSQTVINVEATEVPGGVKRPVHYDSGPGWNRINLDGINPTPRPGGKGPDNDAIERVKLTLSNPSGEEQIARLMFEKTARGILQRIGSPITGISAMLRDAEGNPTGIPVQLSKNWHNDPEGGVYSGAWFHGLSQVRLPAKSSVELELTLVYGHWGGVAAASHAQLCLIGWGSNQLWEQSALGSWGESVCYEPDQVQRGCTVMDVRPLMVRSMGKGEPWGWTANVGGGDFFRFFDTDGNRIPHSAMQADREQQGPCLTRVTYAGRIGENMTHSSTVSLSRTDDLVRAVYHLRLDVRQPIGFSRFVLFQVGADNYNSSREKKMALGNEDGLIKEWATQWGGNVLRTTPVEVTGETPWASLHEAELHEGQSSGAGANRGIVIRDWKARIAGKEASPWFVERGLSVGKNDSSTMDLVPPPGVTQLEAGDYIEATIEHLVVPQSSGDYYGPNEALRTALGRDGNTWKMIQREVVENRRDVTMKAGRLLRLFPEVAVETIDDSASLTLTGCLGYVPVSFSRLRSPRDFVLTLDGQVLDQSVHGNDFWQADYDPSTQSWTLTFNIPVNDGKPHELVFSGKP
jgi:hypothetical protein